MCSRFSESDFFDNTRSCARKCFSCRESNFKRIRRALSKAISQVVRCVTSDYRVGRRCQGQVSRAFTFGSHGYSGQICREVVRGQWCKN